MIGKMIRLMRNASNLRQVDLAKKLNIAQTTLSGYETHYSNPDFDMIERIAEICGFEIIFRNKETNQDYKTTDIVRRGCHEMK